MLSVECFPIRPSTYHLTPPPFAANLRGLTQNGPSSAAGNLFADIRKAPAVQSLARRVEHGGALPFPGVATSAQPFFAALLQKVFPRRPIVAVTENLKTQESCHHDLE